MSIIYKLYHFLKEILSPKYCSYCLKYGSNYFCFQCLKNINFQINFNCLECQRRVVDKCSQKDHRLIKFLISFSNYENEKLRKLVLLGKNSAYEIFSDFGLIIGKILKNYNFQDYYLTPVPLTRRKLLTRGFNQAEVLALAISKETGLKIFNGLIKTRETKDQAELSFEERLKNLESVFSVKEKPPKKIILVDDIKTTGSTLKEAAKTLKKEGTKEIIALTILR